MATIKLIQSPPEDLSLSLSLSFCLSVSPAWVVISILITCVGVVFVCLLVILRFMYFVRMQQEYDLDIVLLIHECFTKT